MDTTLPTERSGEEMERSGEKKLKSERSGEAFTRVEVETKTETRGEEMERFGKKFEIGKEWRVVEKKWMEVEKKWMEEKRRSLEAPS